MRRPQTVERLYLDFDGFFASVEQQVTPELRGKPVGIVPFTGTRFTCVIAVSREAKARGVANIQTIDEALRICPDLILVPQHPDLYRRAHNALLSEITAVLPIDAVKSIDELTCRLDARGIADPVALSMKIKDRIKEHVGPFITSSIGIAANRQLAKMACKAGKKTGPSGYGDGLAIWYPQDMPGPLLTLSLEDVPGIGGRMLAKLNRAGIETMTELLATQPKQLRALWCNVTGERLWYALHGYDIQAQPQQRGMYGHGRVLPPGSRTLQEARAASRLLLTKAARRMRRDGWNAGRVWLWLHLRIRRQESSWSRSVWLPAVCDDQAVLTALEHIWQLAAEGLPKGASIIRLGVTLLDLTPANERQLDLLLNDDKTRKAWEQVTRAIDRLNRKHGRTLVSIGPWVPPPGGYAGGKISYTRIPRAEDFW